MSKFKKFIRLVKLVDTGGKWKFVVLLSMLASIFQVAGISFIIPFLSIATDPDMFRTNYLEGSLKPFAPQDNDELIFIVGVSLVVVYVLSSIVAVYGNYRAVNYSWNFLHKLRSHVLKCLLGKELHYFESRDSSSLIKHLEADCVFFSLNVLEPVINIVSKSILVISFLFIFLQINATIAISLGVILAFSYGLSLQLIKIKYSANLESRNQMFEELYMVVTEVFRSIKYIMLHQSNSYWVNRFRIVSKEISSIEPSVHLSSQVPKYVLEATGLSLVVLYICIQLMLGNSITEFIPLLGFGVFAGYRLLPACQEIYASLNRIINYAYTIELLADLTEEEIETTSITTGDIENSPTDNNSESSHLEMHNVTYKYHGRNSSLIKADMRIDVGMKVGIVGPTGVGKSTLLDLLLGFRFPDEGFVKFRGNILDKQTRDQLRSEVGYVGQETTLLNGSVGDNVRFGSMASLENDDSQVVQACKLAQLDQFIRSELPDGYNSPIGESGTYLSGGQRQRLGIARALFRQPKILVFDEATNALDKNTEDALYRDVCDFFKKTTIIVVTHRPSNLKYFDRTYLLEDYKVKILEP